MYPVPSLTDNLERGNIAAYRFIFFFQELSNGETHTARVKCLAWSPDSSRYVTGGLDSMVILWDDVNCSFKERPKIRGKLHRPSSDDLWLPPGIIK